MRKKSEIKDKISILSSRAKRHPPDIPQSLFSQYQEILKTEIRTLKWVLGHKLPTWYWCVDCQKGHRNLRCPHCGNEHDYYEGLTKSK